jgi:hypothetical protein
MIEYSWMWGPIWGRIWGPIRGYLHSGNYYCEKFDIVVWATVWIWMKCWQAIAYTVLFISIFEGGYLFIKSGFEPGLELGLEPGLDSGLDSDDRLYQMNHCVSIPMIFVSAIFASLSRVRQLLPKWHLLPKWVIAHVSWRGLHLLPKWRPTHVHKKLRTQFWLSDSSGII